MNVDSRVENGVPASDYLRVIGVYCLVYCIGSCELVHEDIAENGVMNGNR